MRRDYGFSSIGVSVITVLCWLIVGSTNWAQKPDERESVGKFKQLQEIEEKFEIEIATSALSFPVKTIHGLIEGKEADGETLEEYQKLFAVEVNRYPKSLVRNVKLLGVVLCVELSFDGQRRNAIPDFEHDVLYLDVKRGDYNRQYQRKVIQDRKSVV